MSQERIEEGIVGSIKTRGDEFENVLIEPIEQLKIRLVGKLKDEFEKQKKQPSDDKNQSKPTLVKFIQNAQYIYDLNERTPELYQYLQRTKSKIQFGFKFFDGILGGRSYTELISDNEDDGSSFYTGYWGEDQFITFSLEKKPDMNTLLRKATNEWDRGYRFGIKRFGTMTKEYIVKEILNNVV